MLNIRELYHNYKDYADKEVTVGAWLRSKRDSKTFGFLVVNDGTFFEPLQIVYSDKLDNFEAISKLNVGAAVIATGVVTLTPDAKQPFEIQATKVEIEGDSTPDYPLQKKRHSFEYLRTISHLRPRTNTFQAVFRVRSLCAYAIHKFFQERDFVYVHTPLITGSDCEGAGEMFQVTTLDLANIPMTEDGKIDYSKDFFSKPTNLTVSGQLNGETYAMAFKNIYTFGPTFRAENSNTTRHAAEFWMIEPEIAFADLKDDMMLAESMLKYVINYVLENAPEEMAFFNQFVDKGLIERLQHVANSDFGHITYTDAIKELEKHEKLLQKYTELNEKFMRQQEMIDRLLAKIDTKDEAIMRKDRRIDELAKKLGAELTLNPAKDDVPAELKKHGFTDIRVVIECAGKAQTVMDAIEYAGKAATVMILSLTDPDCSIPWMPFAAFKKELTLKTSFVNPNTQGRAAHIITSGRLNLKDLISDRIPLDEIGEAFKPGMRNGKIVIVP